MEVVIVTTNKELRQIIKEELRGILRELEAELQVESDLDLKQPPANKSQAAEFLGISYPTLQNLLETKQLDSFLIGNQLKITWKSLYAFARNEHTK